MNNINKPVHEIRLGSVRAAIWANQTQNGIRHSVTLSRSYKADTGWKKTNTYGRDDLPALEKVAELRCVGKLQKSRKQSFEAEVRGRFEQ